MLFAQKKKPRKQPANPPPVLKRASVLAKPCAHLAHPRYLLRAVGLPLINNIGCPASQQRAAGLLPPKTTGGKCLLNMFISSRAKKKPRARSKAGPSVPHGPTPKFYPPSNAVQGLREVRGKVTPHTSRRLTGYRWNTSETRRSISAIKPSSWQC